MFSLPHYDDDILRGRIDVEFELRTIDDSKFRVGLIFKDVYEFREALKNYPIKDSRDILFTRNDKNGVTVECKNIYGGGFMLLILLEKCLFKLKLLMRFITMEEAS